MKLVIEPEELRPVIETVVSEMLNRFGGADRLAYNQAEAAALLGIRWNVLRDARRRGEVIGAKVGRGYLYTRSELLGFLERRKNRRHCD